MDNYIEFGNIANTHGIKGCVKIDVWSDDEHDIDAIKKLYVKDKNGYTELKIKSVSHQNGRALVTFDGYDDIDKILPFKGKDVYADREDIKIDEGAFFITDLIGLDVFDAGTGVRYGKVTDVFNRGASDIYEIKDGTREYLVPAVKEFVEEILLEDSESRKAGIYITPIPGLMEDVNAVTEKESGN